MNYRNLGLTKLRISEIGFGAWGIGGVSKNTLSYGITHDSESKNALQQAFELGITFYDTADLYGNGRSERLIGTVFKKRRKDIVIASKVGFLNSRGDQDFSIKHLKQSIHGSLKRLQTDYLDLYQLHNPAIDLLEKNEAMIDFLKKLKKAGKIRAFGISLRSPEDGLKAVQTFGFKVVQVNFNLVDQRALQSGLFDLCEKENVGIICRTPLCFGFLTGDYSGNEHFGKQDHRSKWPPKQIKRWAGAYQLFRSGASGKNKQTDAQVALRFCLSYRAVSCVIPGMLTTQHVCENCPASRLGPLTKKERAGIEKIYQENSFFIR